MVKDGEIVASAGNRTLEHRNPPGACRNTGHPRSRAQIVSDERLTGCDLYVTLEPCAMCAGAISQRETAPVYYAAEDEKGGAVENGPRFFARKTSPRQPDVYGGIRATQSATILRDFFRSRR